MNHSFSRLLIGALCLAFFGMQAMAEYSVTMPYKQVTVQNVDGKTVFQGAYTSGASGQPALPSYIVSFLLPPGVDFSGVSASINNPSYTELNDAYAISANPPIIHKDGKLEWPKGSIIVAGKDMNVYGKDAFFPADFKGNVSCGHMRQYNVVNIRINPYLYNPVSKKLRMITGGTLTVSISSKAGASSSTAPSLQMRARPGAKAGMSSTTVQIIPRDDWAEKMLKKTIVNPGAFESYGAAPAPRILRANTTTSPSFAVPRFLRPKQTATPTVASAAAASVSGYSYLIVSSDYIWDNSAGLSNFWYYLQDQGAYMCYLDDSYINPNGNATAQQKAENIGNSIIAWYNWCYNTAGITPRYVLLVGNPDTANGDVPMYNYNGIPTDFYYADLSTTWDTDCYAWLCLGRIPVYNTATNNDIGNLDNYIQKVCDYETASGADIEWRRNIITPAVPLGWDAPDESNVVCENIINSFKPFGWNYYRLYDPYDLVNGYSLLPQIVNMDPLPEHVYCHEDDVVNTWNSETPGLVYWAGHGGSTGVPGIIWSNMNNPDPWQHSVTLLNGSYPAMVFAQSCQTSDPQDSFNIGTRILFSNAIDYVGATISGHSDQIQAYWFFPDMLNDYCAGDALDDAKYQTQDVQSSLFFNLFGCPEVSLNLPVTHECPVPQNFAAKAVSKSEIDLSWTTVPNAGIFYIQRSSDFSTKRAGFTPIAEIDNGSLTSYKDIGLSSSTKYKYRVSYVTFINNENEDPSGYSVIDSASTYNASNVNLVAGVPTGLKISAGSNSATLSWSAVSGTTSYNVKRSIHSAGPFVTVANKTAATFLDSNLMNKSTYYFTVSSVNQYGQSANSSVVSVVPASALVVPTLSSPMSCPIDNGVPRPYVALCWFTNPAGDNDLGFNFESALKFPDGTYGQFDSICYSNRESNYGWTWDQPTNSSFAFRMCAVNETNKSAYSNIVEYATPVDANAPPPAAPTGLTATANGPTKFTVNWTNSNMDPVPDSTQVFYKPINGTWHEIDTACPVKTVAISAAPHTKYQIYVRAVKKSVHTDVTQAISCSNYGGTTVTMPTALSTPSSLTASSGFKGQINLAWSDANSSPSGFLVEDATASSGPFTQIAISTAKSYTASNLSDGKAYWFRVRTYKASDTSAYSSTATTTTISNLAVGKTSTASSYQSSNPVKNGNDNSTTTRWCASSGSVPQWWMVDLGASKTLATGEVMWEQSGSGKVYKYKIELSPDNKTWTMAADKTSNTSTSQTQTVNFTSSSMSGRYVRITMTAVPSGAYASFYEFRAFGK